MHKETVKLALLAHKAILEQVINRLVQLERQVEELDSAMIVVRAGAKYPPSRTDDEKIQSDASNGGAPARSPGSSDDEGAARPQGSNSPTPTQ